MVCRHPVEPGAAAATRWCTSLLARAQTGNAWTGDPLVAAVLGAKMEQEDGPAVREAFQRTWGLSWTHPLLPAFPPHFLGQEWGWVHASGLEVALVISVAPCGLGHGGLWGT